MTAANAAPTLARGINGDHADTDTRDTDMRDYHRDYGTFELECWGNGLSYALTHKTTAMQIFVQGDDAIAFEHDRRAAEASFPQKTDDEIMSWLWDQCNYGSAAIQK